MASRKDILDMLARGEIDVDRATQLLSQAHNAPTPDAPPEPEAPIPPAPAPEPPRAPAPRAAGKPRWLRVHISELDTGRNRVKINVPLGLVRLGMKIGARFTDELNEEVIGDVLQALESNQIDGTLVEVEDIEDNERVHVFVE